MRKYNLGFISDELIFKHVLGTLEKYRFPIDLKTFNKNLIDLIKFTFDAKHYCGKAKFDMSCLGLHLTNEL